MSNEKPPVQIKKYANRRLYNTASSAYVTLADLAVMVKNGEDFTVADAKTNEDITRTVLTQIIFEQEGIAGQSLLPITFLRQIIRYYGDSVQALLPSYLEFTLNRFTGEQKRLRDASNRLFGQTPFAGDSFGALQELTQKNLAAFSQALGLFTPFTQSGAKAVDAAKMEPSATELDDLKSQMTQMQKRLDNLAREK